jgi:hypothetical protein
VDIDLTQNCVARVNESMRCVRRNHHDSARFHFVRFIADRDGGAAFKGESDLDIRVRM